MSGPICMLCACADFDPCRDENGEPCSWSEFAPGVAEIAGRGVCSFCAAENADLMADLARVTFAALRQAVLSGQIQSELPRTLVALASETEADRLIRSRRASQ